MTGAPPPDDDLPLRRPPRRNAGGFRAACFIIGVELSERLAYYAVQANLLSYLTQELRESSTEAIKNATVWTGVTLVVPVLGGFVADAYAGKYRMIAILSLVYLAGLTLLTLSASLRRLKPSACPAAATAGNCPAPSSLQVGFFYFALYSISLGTGGIKPCLEAFGADQFDDDDPRERNSKSSFFNWWYFGVGIGGLVAVTVLVYVEANWSWELGFGIPAAVMAVGCTLFFAGTWLYRRQPPGGSPLTQIAQVIVAALRNVRLELPDDPRQLHELDIPPSLSAEPAIASRQLEHTDDFRWLDKAAIRDPRDEPKAAAASGWRLCTVSRVEEVKLVARVVPVWLATLAYGLVFAQTSTVYVSQVGTMRAPEFAGNFRVPAASFQAFTAITVLALLPIYDRVLVPVMRSCTGHERGISPLQRIGTGLFLSVLSLVSAAVVDSLRRRPRPISAFWTVPQFVLIGVADVFTLVGQQEFFYDQVPDSMRSLGMALYLSANGVGYFLSTLVQITVNWASTRGGGSPWIQPYDVARSHYDYFFWVLVVLSSVNLAAFVLIARSYRYKRVRRSSSSQLQQLSSFPPSARGLSLMDSLQRIHHRPSNASVSSTASSQ